MYNKHFEVWQYGKTCCALLKTYPYKIQAIIYCWLKGYVYYGRGHYFLDESLKIKEVSKWKK